MHDLPPEVLRTVLDNVTTGVCLVDGERRIIYWNSGAERITGYLSQEVLGRECRDEVAAESETNSAVPGGSASPLADTIRDGTSRDIQMFLRHKKGHRFPVHARSFPLRDNSGELVGAAEIFEELSAAPAHEHHQSVLGYGSEEKIDVADFSSTQAHLFETLNAFCEGGAPFSVFSVEIEDLSRFAAAHGRLAVVAAMRMVAEALDRATPAGTFLGRWKENRFLMIASGCSAEAAEKIPGRLKRIVGSSSIRWWGDRISVSISVGHASALPDDTAESLMERVEAAFKAGAGPDGANTEPESDSN